MPFKRSYQLKFKREVIDYMESGKSSREAVTYFGGRDNCSYDSGVFRQWFRNKDEIRSGNQDQRRVGGGGTKPVLGSLEELLYDEIIELRISKLKVTRKFIANRALELAREAGIDLKASNHWIDGFMSRHHLSLRRMTNLQSLSNEELIKRAVSYLKYLQQAIPELDRHNTILMDESAVYFEDCRTQTIDVEGRRHVVLKSTGYSSMRITVILAFTAAGKKVIPVLIHKGKQEKITNHNGVTSINQPNAWVNSELLIKWIDRVFPPINMSPKKTLIWDSCRAHISKAVKEHCKRRKIRMIVIPGGLTAYLQAGDIGVYKVFKDNIGKLINDWKTGGHVTLTANGNPRPPSHEVAQNWVKVAWNQIDDNVIKQSIDAAGFHDAVEAWHIARHDVYGSQFIEAWNRTAEVVELDELGEEDDDVDVVDE